MRYRFESGAAVALAAALLVGGCSSSAGPASPPPVEKHDLTVAAVPVADAAALYIAEQRGLFQAQGLHVKIVPVVSGATAIASQLSGQYDVVLGNYVSYILADVHGSKFRVLAPAAAVSPHESILLTPLGSRIENVAQLKGKTIGVNALNNIGTLLVTSLLNANGLDLQTDHIRFKAIPFPEMTHALQTHRVHAAWMVEPFVTYAEMTGAQPLADTDAGATQNLPIAGYMVTQSWDQKYPGTAAAFRHALLEGQRIASVSQPAVWRGVEAFAKIPPRPLS
jgi:NitT/TauT family transport system substrate-binding protein